MLVVIGDVIVGPRKCTSSAFISCTFALAEEPNLLTQTAQICDGFALFFCFFFEHMFKRNYGSTNRHS